jgi:hypothetical protein
MAAVKHKGPPDATQLRQQAEKRLQGIADHTALQPAQSQKAMQGLVH